MTTQSNLATVLQDLGDLEGAKSLLVPAYEALKNLLGENHRHTVTIKNNLQVVLNEIQEQNDGCDIRVSWAFVTLKTLEGLASEFVRVESIP